MKVSVSFRQVNAAFDLQFAKDNHAGKESDGNRKFHWEEILKVKANVKALNVLDNTDYTLLVPTTDGKEKPYKIPNMQVLQCFMDSGDIVEYAVSSDLVDHNLPAEKTTNGRTFYTFYIRDKQEYINTGNGVIIAAQDFPNELRATR